MADSGGPAPVPRGPGAGHIIVDIYLFKFFIDFRIWNNLYLKIPNVMKIKQKRRSKNLDCNLSQKISSLDLMGRASVDIEDFGAILSKL